MHQRPQSEAPPDIADELRQKLLDPDAQRPLDLHEVEHASTIFFGAPDVMRLYGMAPRTYYARGIRIAARTVVECVADCSAADIAGAVRGVLQSERAGAPVAAIDLFAGSGNLLYQLARAAQAPISIGFERDDVVYRLTRVNFQQIGFQATLERGRCEALLEDRRVPRDHLCLVIVAPPWGAAFDFSRGLDLRRTTPPIEEIFALIRARLRRHEVLCVVQTHEIVVEESIAALASGRRIYARGTTRGLPPGRNVGFLICPP